MDASDEVLELARALIRIDTSNPPGHETLAAELVREVLADAGIDVQLVARDGPGGDRANVVARIPGTGGAPSLAFVGHLDVVPADARDWTHPPFEARVDDEGYLYGRGAVDMKNEVAARTVAMARLARSGWRPRGDLWLLMVSDEEDGRARTGMEWLVEAMPEVRCDHAVNEGGGVRLRLADGRVVHTVSTGEKGTYPARVTARGEAGHASTPTIGRNAVPLLGRLLGRIGDGLPPAALPEISRPFFEALLGAQAVAEAGDDPEAASRLTTAAMALHPALVHLVPALTGTTMAPTMLQAGLRLNVMPARAQVDVDCRVLPGATPAQLEAELRDRLDGNPAVPYDLEWIDRFTAGTTSPAAGPLVTAIQDWLDDADPGSGVLPMVCTGFTDSTHLRGAFGTAAYGYSPFLATPADVVASGYHNRDERVHVDDLTHSVAFHEYLARRLLG
ncbi:MAG TPA: M20/M25/M40 family metallo-hydrolase [Kineosporiaceae bacterium]|nr:M20/M25/M40 family metallo-hydrolase [Kineosporiaceae bacterium]